MKPGTLVRIFAPGAGFIDEFGVALFLRRLIPSRDLSADHDFWRNRNIKPDVIADSWHNEVLYHSGIHIIVEKQFVLVPLDTCDV